ncbi:Major Facilitator Superfamily protein [Clavibacter michiganensis]|uniref:Major Facilitator Superfamily protein n=1 Tax=Clavibacter michiganensis TaxID=28447 RepID=A0A251XSM7_9MICO|nr:Major Facilitator Superfamily protein [Clavibacter michiganensis]
MTTALLTPPAAVASRPRHRLAHAAGFWTTAVAFTVVMAYATVPTPLYALYQQRDGFPTWVLTVVFAAYAVGVVASLFLVGHLSDQVGRRRLSLLAVGVEVVSAALFLLFPEVPGLIVARLVSGVGVGMLTATATAHLGELHAAARPEGSPQRAAAVSGVANIGGLALGPLAGGLAAELLPAPLVVPHAVFLVLLLLALGAVALVPETVRAPALRRPYRPQRVAIPAASRGAFAAAAAAAFAGFAVFGLFTSLAPTFLATTLGQTGRLLSGSVSFAVFAAAAVSPLVAARLDGRRQVAVSLVLLPAGLVLLAAGGILASLALFVAGGVLAAAGVGLSFRNALATAGALVEPARRGEVLAAVFLVAYAGMAVPALVAGVALARVAPVAVLTAFAAVVLALGVAAGAGLLRATRRG